jgi:hypothetical protein
MADRNCGHLVMVLPLHGSDILTLSCCEQPSHEQHLVYQTAIDICILINEQLTLHFRILLQPFAFSAPSLTSNHAYYHALHQ